MNDYRRWTTSRPGDGGDSHDRGESKAPTDDPFVLPDEALDPEELPARTALTREPAEGFSVDTLTAAIKKAKKDGDDESWNSQKGPQLGTVPRWHASCTTTMEVPERQHTRL